MDRDYILLSMDGLVSSFLQDSTSFWPFTPRPPITIAMATRVVRPREQQNREISPSSTNRTPPEGDNTRQPLHPSFLYPDPEQTASVIHPRHRRQPSAAPTNTTTATPTVPNQNISTPSRGQPNPTGATFSSYRSSHVVHLWPPALRSGDYDDDEEEDAFNLVDLPPPLHTSQRGEANIDHDPYLAAFAEGDFSSPSTYPSFTQSTTQPNDTQSQIQNQSLGQSLPDFESLTSGIFTPPPLPSGIRTTAPRDPSGACISDQLNNNEWPPAPPRTTSQLSSSTNACESQSTLHTADSFDESTTSDTPLSSFSSNMPQTRRQSRCLAPAQLDGHANKRRRTSLNASSQTQLNSTPTKMPRQHLASKDIHSLLDSPPRQVTPEEEPRFDDLPTIDLTEATEVPEYLKKPVEDKRIKLSAFQCVICMDDATALTVTHCGHLYCAQCLHSSLHVDVTKGKCPMCRQKLDMKPRGQYNTKTKGYWPLELKLMTATRKGKRKANTMS